MAEIRALTVRQPWGSMIALAGKTVENRTWSPAYRGLVAVHAGARSRWDSAAEESPFARDAWGALAERAPLTPALRRDAGFPFGAVITVAELTGCHGDFDCRWKNDGRPCSPWAMLGSFHWQLASVRPLAEPVPCKGMLGLWRLPEEAEKAVRAQLEEAGHG